MRRDELGRRTLWRVDAKTHKNTTKIWNQIWCAL